MATLDALVVELKADISGLQSSIRRATADIQGFEGKVNQTTSNIEVRAQRMGLAIGASLAAAGVGAVSLGRSLFAAGASMQALEGRMLAATGSAEASADSIAFLRAETERLGLRFTDTANGFAGFSAAALRAGLSMQQVREVFVGVSEAAVAFRLTNENTQGVFLALSQIASKGVVSMEELRQQLGERLPIAMEAAARGMGVTQAELFKMVETGSVTAQEFLPAFGRAIRENLGDAVVQSSKSAQSELNRLSNEMERLKAVAANGAFMSAVADAARDMSNALSEPAMQEGLTALANGLGTIVTMAAKAVAGLGLLAARASEYFEVVEIRRKALLEGVGLDAANARVESARDSRRRTADLIANPSASRIPAGGGLLTGGFERSGGLLGNTGVAGVSDFSAVGSAANTAAVIREGTKEVVKATREREEAVAEIKTEFRNAEFEQCLEHEAKIYEVSALWATERQKALEGFLGQRVRTIQEIGADEIGVQAQNFRTTIQQAAQHNKTFFQMEKVAALAQAALKARESVVSAYAFGSRLGGPVLGAAFAGVAAAAQAANLAAIASTSFGGGNSVTGGGGGGNVSGANEPTDNLGRPIQQSRQVYITIQGEEDALFSKRTVRKLLEQVNDAIGDGSRLAVAVAS